MSSHDDTSYLLRRLKEQVLDLCTFTKPCLQKAQVQIAMATSSGVMNCWKDFTPSHMVFFFRLVQPVRKKQTETHRGNSAQGSWWRRTTRQNQLWDTSLLHGAGTADHRTKNKIHTSKQQIIRRKKNNILLWKSWALGNTSLNKTKKNNEYWGKIILRSLLFLTVL